MNLDLLKTITEKFLNEGAYSNGRYEHPEGKKVNKYHPGHANPTYTHTGYENGKPYIKRWGNVQDDWRASWKNPMNAKYADQGSYGKEGTNTNYRKGEVPNGYVVWTKEDEQERQAAWNKVMEVIKSTGVKNPRDVIYKQAAGRYKLPEYYGNSCPFTKIQLLRIQKALDELNKLELRKDRAERNNEKYDNSRSDRQIKKDVRMWEKDKEDFNYRRNGAEKTPHTQSKDFRKRVNSELIRTALKREKDAKKADKEKAKKEYIDAKREENKKKIWSKEAFEKREERRNSR